MIHNPLHDLATIRKIALYCAAVTLVVACAMSFKFGWSMSVLHAIGLALITICTAIIVPYIGHQWRSGSRVFAAALVPIAALLALVEFGTHTGYTNGVRTIETESTGVHNAAYQRKQEGADRNASLLKDLRADLARLKEGNPWVTTISADGLKAQIAAKDEAIRQEAGRGGCGPICLKLTEEKAALEDQKATAEKSDDLSRRIDALQKIVDAKETEAASADYKSSEVVAQTSIFAKAIAWSLEPTQAEKEGTQIGVGFAMSLATTFLPAVFMLMAFGPVEYVPGHRARTIAATDKAADGEVSLLRAKLAEMQEAIRRPSPAQHEPMSVHLHEADKLADLNGTLAALKRLAAQPQLRAA